LVLVSRFRQHVPFSSCPSSSSIAPLVFKDVDIATIKIDDPIISNLIQVPYKKKNTKVKWEMEKFFQDTQATKFV
jgi:hypothetical protein